MFAAPLQRGVIREDRKASNGGVLTLLTEKFLSALEESQTKEKSDRHFRKAMLTRSTWFLIYILISHLNI